MKLFTCQKCGQLLYFENTRCENCGLALGFLPSEAMLSTLDPSGNPLWKPLAQNGQVYRFCANYSLGVCNWMIPEEDSRRFCIACQLNRTIPSLDDPEQRQRWWLLESVKHRLVYTLLQMGLPFASKADDEENGLAFDFLTELVPGSREGTKVMTGHLNGVITIDTAEADPAERERRRVTMGEPYRTLPGHFRHEVGHHYWGRFFQDEAQLSAFRSCFGDEREDYGEALQSYYSKGAPPDWRGRFVSAYASAHPWEDWAETWAHYLHIIDTMETASAFGLEPLKRIVSDEMPPSRPNFDPYPEKDFDRLIKGWLPLTYAVNSLNRSMGLPDLYPFILSPAALEKLQFVHSWIHEFSRQRASRRKSTLEPLQLPDPAGTRESS